MQAPRTLPPDKIRQLVIETLDRMVSATTVSAVWAEHVAAMAVFGFDRLFYGFTRQHTPQGLGPRDEMLVLSNHDEAYLGPYLAEEKYVYGPMTAWARQNVGAMSWSWINENKHRLSDKQLAVLDFNLSHGVIAGYTISFRDAVTRNKGAIALTAQVEIPQHDIEAVWNEFSSEINVVNQTAHLRYTSLPWPGNQSGLSPRQREVLEWVGDGKTIADTATIMGLKAATVEKHLKKAREALKVETTAQAVMKAAQSNQIFVVDPAPS